jgi:hypothetical protein
MLQIEREGKILPSGRMEIMSQQLGIPLSAWNSLTQLVDHCAQIKPGQEVVILAHEDGVYGSDNWCDPQAVSWVKTAFASRGARVTVLWADEQAKEHAWRFPPVVKGAIAAADVFVNLSNDLVVEEVAEFRNFLPVCKTWYIRLFPVTANLLMTKWAQTPHELVCMVRHLSSNPFMKHLSKFKMTDPNGTELEGLTLDPVQRPGIPGMPYNSWRRDASPYIPYPEWVHPPINCKDVNGVFFFDAMLPWWSHYIGIKSSWETPIRIDVKDSRMTKISGGIEATKLENYLASLESKVGNGIWKFDTFHFGIHPNATVNETECPNADYRRIVDHSHTSNIHWHIGSAPGNEKYNYYPHITGDVRNSTLTVEGKLVFDNGWQCVLDDPRLAEIAAKYPGLPGIPTRVQKLELAGAAK